MPSNSPSRQTRRHLRIVSKLSKVSSKVLGSTDRLCVRSFAPQSEMSMTLQPRAPGCPFEEQQRASPDTCPANCSSIAARTRHHSPSSSYSMNFLYCQWRPSCRRHTRPRTRRPVMDRLGKITVQRCQNSAPAGFKLCASGGSIAVNMEPSPRSFVSGPIR